MAKITTAIPLQSFEIVRNRIGEILKEEFHNQSVLDGNNKDIDPEVYLERLVPFDKTDLPVINVALATGTLEEHTAKQSNATYTYYIEAYTRAASNDNNYGDVLAMFKLHRLLGIARAILEDTRYITLGFMNPFIIRRYVSEIVVGGIGKDELENVVIGRLSLVVQVPEGVALPQPRTMDGFTTQVKLELTDKGYRWGIQEE